MADDAHVDALLAQLGVTEGPLHAVCRPLVARAIELGGTDEEILASSSAGRLGPLLVDLSVRPAGETLTLEAYLERTALDPDFVRRAWTAFGLPTSVGTVPAVVPPDAAHALEVVHFMREFFGEDAVLGIARVIGSATASIADALANATRIGAEMPNLDAGRTYDDVTNEMTNVTRELLPTFWEAVAAIFRRHLVLVSYGSWAPDATRAAVTTTRTVGFVDLVDSTEVLRSQSVAELAASVDAFERLVWERVTAAGGRVVKLIGDEAMFVVGGPRAACDIAKGLVTASTQTVRVGLAHGEIVALHGDCYGPTVNLAARLVAVAEPGTILVSESVADAARRDHAVEAVKVGPLRGFADVTTAYVVR